MKKNTVILLVLAVIVAGGGWWYYQENKVLTLKMSATDSPPPRFLLAVIKDKGLDKKHGLNVEVMWAAPGEVERRLSERTGGVEVGFYNVLSMLDTNLKQGTSLRVIAPALQVAQVLLVAKDSLFKSVSDLKNTRLTIRPKGTAAYTSQAIVLKIAGFDIDKDFKIVFGSPQQGAAFLEKGEVDAVLLSPPDAAPLLATGRYRLITELDAIWQKTANAPFPFVDIAAHADWIEQNSKKMERFRSMLKEATSFIKDNPQIIGDYKDLLNIKNDSELQSITRAMTSIYSDSWDFKAHRFLIEKAAELGFLKSMPLDEDVFAK